MSPGGSFLPGLSPLDRPGRDWYDRQPWRSVTRAKRLVWSRDPGVTARSTRRWSASRPATSLIGLTRPTCTSRHSGGCRRAGSICPVSRRARPPPARRAESRGISQLYTHQAQAIDHALAGRNVVVITPTASGKTLCYNAPISTPSCRIRRAARCICFRPRRWRRISSPSCRRCARRSSPAGAGRAQIGVFTYDGDTPQDARRTIRRARTSSSATPTCSTRASCRIIRAGRSCSRTFATWSSTIEAGRGFVLLHHSLGDNQAGRGGMKEVTGGSLILKRQEWSETVSRLRCSQNRRAAGG